MFFSNGYITSYQSAELARLKSDLKKQAEEVCRKYYSDLGAKIVAACSQHSANQATFKKSFDTLISNLQAKYNECATRRTTAIAEYEKKIKAVRDSHRATLVSSINKVINIDINYWPISAFDC